MDEVQAIRAALADPRRVVEAFQLARGAQRYGSGILVLCPWHSERSPSCSVHRGGDGTIAVRCHSCGATGDLFSLRAAQRGLDPRKDFRLLLEELAQLAGVTLIRPGDRVNVTAPMPAAPPPPPPEGRDYPPADDVHDLLDRCGPCAKDPAVSAWIRSRHLVPEDVDRGGLAFALPLDVELPTWARYRGKRPAAEPWNVLGYRLIFPLRDHLGRVRSVRARAIVTGLQPKALPPAGHKVKGLVLADALAAVVLQAKGWPGATDRAAHGLPAGQLVIAEGEPDFLTWATADGALNRRDFAVMGIQGSGSWSAELGEAIPDRSEVIAWTDPDDAGDRYADELAASMAGRVLFRVTDPAGREQRRRAREEAAG